MKITYKKLSKNFSANKLKEFFDEALPGKTVKQCNNIIKHSSIIIGAFDGNKLVGTTRVLDDTVYAFITDVLVNPKYRKQNIGKSIIKMICDELIKKDIKIIFCNTSKELIPFYKSGAKFKYDSKDVVLYIRNFKKKE